jgi:glycosyltransferase involved in cell wall biosynthesis
MAEALCSGLAVITTAWGGQTDFCTPETSWLIDYRFERAETHFEVSDSVWAEPDEAHLAQLMREVHDAPPQLRSQRILAGQRSLAENHQWRHVAQRMVAAARDWSVADSGRSPRIAWVSTWNVRCGIAAYSRHLVNAMPERVAVLAAHSAELIEADGDNVSRCWSPGEDDDLSGLAAEIEARQSDTVVVQFNYGFFEFTRLASFLTRQCEAGRVVVVVVHATQDPEHVPHKRLASLADALRACARVLVHSPLDMNRLKKLGVDAVALFPHGVVDFQAPPPRRRILRPWVLGSYGFALPHKGLVQLVEAFALLRQRGRRVHLKLWNAAYPVAESQATIDEVNAAVSRLGLEQAVSFDTAYAEDAESLQRLASADLLVFPYQRTGESSSAAVRMGLASQRPVAVTPLDIFDDVRGATHALPGVTPHDMAEGLDQLMARLESGDQQTGLIAAAAETWRAEHGYCRLGQRMYRMLCALRMDSLRAVPVTLTP